MAVDHVHIEPNFPVSSIIAEWIVRVLNPWRSSSKTPLSLDHHQSNYNTMTSIVDSSRNSSNGHHPKGSSIATSCHSLSTAFVPAPAPAPAFPATSTNNSHIPSVVLCSYATRQHFTFAPDLSVSESMIKHHLEHPLNGLQHLSGRCWFFMGEYVVFSVASINGRLCFCCLLFCLLPYPDSSQPFVCLPVVCFCFRLVGWQSSYLFFFANICTNSGSIEAYMVTTV
jgi:hypothetical protein